MMATVTLNRATHVLRVDLNDDEFAVLDALMQSQGTGPIDRAVAYLIQQQQIEKKDKQKRQLKDYIETARDAKREELQAIMDADTAK